MMELTLSGHRPRDTMASLEKLSPEQLQARMEEVLPQRYIKVLKLYLGLEDGRKHTLEEIGILWGVSRERIRQLRDRALLRLRDEGISI